jgi:hypothetical protein
VPPGNGGSLTEAYRKENGQPLSQDGWPVFSLAATKSTEFRTRIYGSMLWLRTVKAKTN